MFNVQQLAMVLLQRNPAVANNPRAQELIRVIQSGDEKRGAEIASNLCETYGTTKEEALQQAIKYFGLPHNRR